MVAVCDVLPKEKVDFTDDLPFFSSIEDLLASDVQFDVVNICTPNFFHAPYALMVLDKRHHVVIEKPIALSKADAPRPFWIAR